MHSDDFTCAVSNKETSQTQDARTFGQNLKTRLHDPYTRRLVGHVDDWELRVFGETDPGYVELARSGYLHLQLWNRRHHVSLLTPSPYTNDAFEISPIKGKVFRARDLDRIRIELIGQYGLKLPPTSRMNHLIAAWATDAPAQHSQRRGFSKSK